MSQESYGIPPSVKWYSRKHRERTPKHKIVKKELQQLATEVWNRLPPSARIVISNRIGWKETIFLVNEPVDGDEKMAANSLALYGKGEIIFNVHETQNKKSLKNRRCLNLFTIVHELAHVFWDSISLKAHHSILKQALDAAKFSSEENVATKGESSEDTLEGYSSVRVHLNADILNAFSYHPVGVSSTDFLDEWALQSETVERVADAITLSWGFGEDYIDAICFRGIPSLDDIRDGFPVFRGLETEVLRMCNRFKEISEEEKKKYGI